MSLLVTIGCVCVTIWSSLYFTERIKSCEKDVLKLQSLINRQNETIKALQKDLENTKIYLLEVDEKTNIARFINNDYTVV